MNNLPIKLCYAIFKYLPLDELCRLRLINKRFHNMIKDYKIEELSFYDSIWRIKDIWLFIMKPIYPINSINISKLSIFFNSSSLNLGNLKRLSITSIKDDDNFNLDLLNRFINLEHLELDFESKWSKNNKLKLPNLRILMLNFNIRLKISIDAPNLNALQIEFEIKNDYNPFDSIQFLNSSIKHLMVFGNLNLSKLINLSFLKSIQTLECYIEQLNQINIFEILKKLKSVDILLRKNEDYRDIDLNILANMIKQRNKLRRSDVKIWFENIQLSNEKELRELDFKRANRLSLQMKHYHKLADKVGEMDLIDYTELMRLTNSNLPIDFFKKYNVQEIVASDKIEDQNSFITFLLNCIYLKRLCLINSSLSQSFYDRLPSSTSLIALKLKEDEHTGLDFKFINKIQYLNKFYTNQKLSLDIILNLNKFKFIDAFVFKFKNQMFFIERSNKDAYDMHHFNDEMDTINMTIKESVSFEEMTEWFKN